MHEKAFEYLVKYSHCKEVESRQFYCHACRDTKGIRLTLTVSPKSRSSEECMRCPLGLICLARFGGFCIMQEKCRCTKHISEVW